MKFCGLDIFLEISEEKILKETIEEFENLSFSLLLLENFQRTSPGKFLSEYLEDFPGDYLEKTPELIFDRFPERIPGKITKGTSARLLREIFGGIFPEESL